MRLQTTFRTRFAPDSPWTPSTFWGELTLEGTQQFTLQTELTLQGFWRETARWPFVEEAGEAAAEAAEGRETAERRLASWRLASCGEENTPGPSLTSQPDAHGQHRDPGAAGTRGFRPCRPLFAACSSSTRPAASSTSASSPRTQSARPTTTSSWLARCMGTCSGVGAGDAGACTVA